VPPPSTWPAPARPAGSDPLNVNGPLFYLCAAATLAGAGAVVALGDMRRVVLAFAGFSLALGLLLLVMGADLVAAVEIVVGAGAVPAVVLAGLVLTGDPAGGSDAHDREPAGSLVAVLRRWPVGLAVAAAFTALVVGVVAASRGVWISRPYPSEALDHGTTATLGRTLFSLDALPFEGVGVLLLAAAVGSTVLARRDRMERDMDRVARERAEREERVRRRREDRVRARQGRRPPAGESGVAAAALPGEEDGG
jgi:NADH-quinone oxidoreductase subunit J